jgi:SP family arabinose:H+ symporter-like MFS transporter
VIGTRLIAWSITSALAGFLFGFDTVVISGAEQTIQSLWHLGPTAHGITVAAALYGTVVGSLLAGWLADRLGRKGTLIIIGLLYIVGAGWSALAGGVSTFILARVIGGIGIGASTVTAPLYISEISPPQYRGRLTGLFQFNIVLGILVAYLSNALLSAVGDNAWRWMLGVAALPALADTILCFALPESPRWLLGIRGDLDKGSRVLRLIEPEATDESIRVQSRLIQAAPRSEASTTPFWSRAQRRPIMLAVLIALFNQLSGINAILYFAPRIFQLAGLGSQAALLNSVGIGLTNLIFTLIGVWLIDRLGRRMLLYIGSLGYISSLIAIAWAFHSKTFVIVPVCIFSFIAAHAIGQGAVIWVYISEIFPNQHRAQGQALGTTTHWVMAALITTLFPEMVTRFDPSAVFLFFASMMLLQIIWVRLKVIETKGMVLEDIQGRLRV